ncbi:MAG: hypothetical protein JNN03_01830 [Rubrivivax sp.]|nr:hypothetical protein [Rubrivivax sp.]
MTKSKVSALGRKAAIDNARALPASIRATLDHVDELGQLVVSTPWGQWACEVLDPSASWTSWNPGDRVLVLPPEGNERAVVLGKLSLVPVGPDEGVRCIEAPQRLSLKCGESSIDLRADGKVMIRGEDVLVRAKGTKRIRAGTVSIN